MYLWPRTIRWQMLLGLVLIETLSIALFAFLLTDYLQHQVSSRTHSRLDHQSLSLALQVRQPILDNRGDLILQAVKLQAGFGSVLRTFITDPTGKILFTSEAAAARRPLTAEELAEIRHVKPDASHIFQFGNGRQEGARPIYNGSGNGSGLLGYAWVEAYTQWDKDLVSTVLRATVLFGGGWIMLSTF